MSNKKLSPQKNGGLVHREGKEKKKQEFPQKYFVSANELLLDSYKLAKKIHDDNFEPTFIVALWRGGSLIGCAVQEYFAYHDIDCDHIAVRTTHYKNDEIDQKDDTVQVFGLNYIVENAECDDKLLIVDDVFDMGLSANAVVNEIRKRMRKNSPKEIEIATVYYKPKRKVKEVEPPRFFLHATDDWVVFPHELGGLSEKEINEKGDDILKIIGNKKKKKK